MFRRWLPLAALIVCVLMTSALAAEPSAVKPLAQAHAHNDYLHKRPLLDALDHGFNSVEADIFLVDGKLLVAHTASELRPDRTLEGLYLEPLRQRVAENGGRVFRDGQPFNLLIDFKSAAEPTYAALAKVLASYSDIITAIRDGQIEQKAVNVAISGNRPIETLKNESLRYAGYDGRMGDLNSDVPAHRMPLVSDNWNLQFRWRGRGDISAAERQKLRDAVAKAHARGRKIRFWATPENVDTWRELQAAGVDMINTDDLAGLEKFLRAGGQADQ